MNRQSLTPPHGTCLSRLQRQLERTYEVAVPHAVTDFVVHQDVGMDTTPGQVAAGAPEKLLLVEYGDRRTVDLGLYLAQELLDDLRDDDPTLCLHDGNLAAFLTVLEGVSHFVYLLWNARHRRPVSLMELELQAEVDKFVSASVLYASQRGAIPAGLGKHLFDSPSFDRSLSAEARARYEKANHYAGQYCWQLERQFLKNRAKDGFVNELRRFYRFTRVQKLRHIEAGESSFGPAGTARTGH